MKKIFYFYLLIALALFFVCPNASFAQRGKSGYSFEFNGSQSTGLIRLNDSVKINNLTKKPAEIYRPWYKPQSGTLEQMGREYLKAKASYFGLVDNTLSDLQYSQSTQNNIANFIQTFRGIPIYQRYFRIIFGRTGWVSYVTSSYQPITQISNVVPSIHFLQAQQTALSYIGLPASKAEFIHHELMIFVSKTKGQRLAYKINVNGFQVFTDAMNNEVLEALNMDQYFYPPQYSASAKIFLPDPLTTARTYYGASGFIDNGDVNSPELNTQLVNVNINVSQDSNGLYLLENNYASVLSDSTNNNRYTQNTTNFSFNRSQPNFEAVMCYYHITDMLQKMGGVEGITLRNRANRGGPLQFKPHAFLTEDNSFFRAFDGIIYFGNGRVDDAEDATVIWHELGHAIHDWLTDRYTPDKSVEGVNEGLADALAAMMKRHFYETRNCTDTLFYKLFSWDRFNERTTDYKIKYPNLVENNKNVQPYNEYGHKNGQILSTAIMKIYDDIGFELTKELILNSLILITTNDTTQDIAAQKIFMVADSINKTRQYPESFYIAPIYKHLVTAGYNVTVQKTFDYVDVYMKDTPCEKGKEPNTVSKEIWVSEDIWVRVNDDNGTTHQNPQYDKSGIKKLNYVYIRVSNRGFDESPSSAFKTIQLYWAKASPSLTWRKPWDKTVFANSGKPMGDSVGAVRVLSVLPDSSVVVKIPWTVPNPADYPEFGSENNHFCLLARLQESSSYPHGMSFREKINSDPPNLHYNIVYNNNIVLKNLTVSSVGGQAVNKKSGGGCVAAANYGSESMPFSFAISVPDAIQKEQIFSQGVSTLRLDNTLYQSWVAGGMQGNAISVLGNNTIMLLSSESSLDNIVLNTNEVSSTCYEFTPTDLSSLIAEETFNIDLIQKQGDQIIGGERFQITLLPTIKDILPTNPNETLRAKKTAETPKISNSQVETERLDYFAIFPNPTNSEFFINGSRSSQTPFSVSLFDMSGREVIRQTFIQNTTLNVSQLPKGFYIVKITNNDNNGVFAQKVSVQ